MQLTLAAQHIMMMQGEIMLWFLNIVISLLTAAYTVQHFDTSTGNIAHACISLSLVCSERLPQR